MSIYKTNKLLGALSSLKLSLVLLLVFAAAIGRATFIEAHYSTAAAQALVYSARWFEILLFALCINLLLALGRWYPFRARQTGFLIVHLSIVVILAGALITRYFGQEGSMSIREGASSDVMYSREDYVKLSSGTTQKAFEVRLYKKGPQGISHTVKLDGRDYHVSVEEFWPHYEESWVEGEGGEPAVRLTASGEGGAVRRVLRAGEEMRAAGVRIRFEEGDPTTEGSGPVAPYGRLQIKVGDDRGDLEIPDQPPAETEVGGYRFLITEFNSDFIVGSEPPAEHRMSNPMIRVQVIGPDGKSEERMLFAYHPDFAMNHSGQEESFADVDMVYSFARSFNLFRAADDTLTARSTLALVRRDMTDMGSGEEIAPGDDFQVEPLTLYQTASGDFSFVLQEVMDSAVRGAAESDDPKAPAAALVRVDGPDGETVEAVAVHGDPQGGEIVLGDTPLHVGYGPVLIELPYTLQLDDFVLETYPGSDNPASFESHVRLFDEEKNIAGRPYRIYMNHPLNHRGYKHFQSSYDADRKGTILSVNHDPGKLPTYVGYILITIGFVLVLAKDLIWPRRPGETADKRGGEA